MKKTKLSLIIFLLVVTILLTTQSISASDHNKSTDAIKKDYKTQSTTKIQSKTSTNNLKKDTKTITNTTNTNNNKKSITKKDTTKNTKRTITPEETSSEVIYTTDDLKDLPTINENLKDYDNEVNATVKLETGNYNYEGISTSLLRLTDYTKIRNVTFDGQGSTIDLSQAPNTIDFDQVFLVSNGYTLTINNVTLKNFDRTTYIDSIIRNYGNLEINNSYFTDNRNSRSDNAGSGIVLTIYSNSNTLIYNSNFKNNVVGSRGSIIKADTDNQISTKISINNSNFTDNKLLYVNGNINPNSDGGVIWQAGYSNLSINNSLFKNNIAGRQGGVVYQGRYSNLTVDNSSFEENQAAHEGVFAQDDGGNIYLYNSNFTSNIATNNYGGVLSQRRVLIIDNCNFTSNQAKGTEGGGVIFCYSKDRTDAEIRINNSRFISNLNPSGTGGVICDYTSCQNCPLYINNSIFKANSAAMGGVIFRTNKADSKIENSEFESNVGTHAGVICLFNSYPTEMTLINVTMNNNRVSSNGGLFYTYSNTKLSIYNSTLNGTKGNTVIFNQGTMELSYNNITDNWGNRVFHNTGTLSLKYNNLTNNSAVQVLLLNNKETTLSYNNITDNYITHASNYIIHNNAGATINIDHNTFINNTDNTRDMLLNNNTERTFNVADNNVYIDNFLEDSIEDIESIIITGETEKVVQIKINLRNVYNNKIINGTIILYDENDVELTRLNVTNGICDLNLPLSKLSGGIHDLTVKYETLSKHYQNKTTKMIVNIYKNTEIIIDVTSPVYVRNETNIKITLKDKNGMLIDNQEVNVTVDGMSEVYTTNNGIIEIPVTFTESGSKEVSANFTGTEYLGLSYNKTTINVIKHDTYMILEVPESVKFGEKVTINVTLMDKSINKAIGGEFIYLYINGTDMGARLTNSEGKISLEYTPQYSGNVEVLAEHFVIDNEFYNKAKNVTKTFTVKNEQIKTQITVEATNTKINKTNTIKIHLTDIESRNLDMQVTVTIDSKKFNVTTKNGIATITNYSSTTAKKVKVTVDFGGNDKYKESSNQTTFEVNKLTTTINLDTIKTVSVGENTEISGKLLDENNNPLSNVIVTITIDGKKYNVTTASDGSYSKTVVADVTGTNNVSVSYSGNDKYLSSSAKTSYSVDKLSTKLTVDSINSTNVGDKAKITGKLVDENGRAVSGESVKVTVDGKTYTVKTAIDGSFTVNALTGTAGKLKVSVVYDGNSKYGKSKATTYVKVNKRDVNVKVKSVAGIVGEKITFTATVTDKDGKKVNSGNLVFKLNGVSFNSNKRFDNSSKEPYKFTVKDGKVSVTVTADYYLRNGGNITATYSGSDTYNDANSDIANLTVKLRNMKISVKAEPSTVKQYKNVTFIATVTDVTKNAKNKTAILDNSYVLFKINGKTLKVKGKVANVTVKSNKVTYTYTIPAGTAGIYVNRNIRYYNVTAVYGSKLFYMDSNSNTTKYNVARSKITITVNNAVLKNKKLAIKGTIKDYMKKYLKGINKVCLKLDGETYKINGKVKYFNVKNGRINLKNIKISNPSSVKKVSVVSGDRVAYLSGKSKAKKIVKI